MISGRLLYTVLEENQPYQNTLYKQNRRNPKAEVPVLRFMMKNKHPQERSNAPAYDSNTDKRFLADPPFAPSGPAFIDAVHKKRDNVDCKKIYDQYQFDRAQTLFTSRLKRTDHQACSAPAA